MPTNIPIGLPYPYPPNDPLTTSRPKDALTPLLLVGSTTLAMSLELLDFAPFFRIIDAHSLWHLSTIPLAVAWWTFLATDAVELEGSMLQGRGVTNVASDEKMPLTGGNGDTKSPNIPGYAQLSPGMSLGRNKSPRRSGLGEKGERGD